MRRSSILLALTLLALTGLTACVRQSAPQQQPASCRCNRR
ncbi:Hypothetical protein CAP_6630 [Chondromyces apiculatus DSM 436]|uniref:Uncharacterized protein n=1 Tax=Chondromyces apiculatus DSM 436 TaxID=1192034 RepID=A0A017T1L4_9BACT|nr:Hypothetical protein CAP_6630 [Chondromyces apiculatus DSM 436]